MKDWSGLIDSLSIESRAFIDGAYTAAASGKTFPTVNPATEEVLAQVAFCGAPEVERAVKAARRSFNEAAWANLAPRKRAAVLKKFAALMREHSDELAALESLDVGKPIKFCQAVDISGSIYCTEWFAEAVDKVGGEVVPTDPHLLGMVTREPVGVVAAIVPWNFPMSMSAWKYAPALAAGNAVILKPSEKSPLTAIRIAALAHEAGVPAGIFQVLPGDGSVGQMLAEHHDVDCVGFTGSTAVGKKIAAYAANSNLKRVWLELGGKSPHIVFADCGNLKAAAEAAAAGIYYNTGQMCSAGSRLLLERGIRDAFLAEFAQAAAAYTPKMPFDESAKMGPIVDDIQFKKVMNYIDIGKQEGTLLLGGAACPINGKGYFIEPTAFEVAPNSTLAREEIFGPVLGVMVFDTEEEAIRLANDTEYGLGAGVWSDNISRAHRVAAQLRAGSVWVNCYEESGDMNLPFGGYKQSGNGRDKSLHALEKYTELKTTLIKLDN